MTTRAWAEPSDAEGADDLPYVLTKNKVLKVVVEWAREPAMVRGRMQYVLSGASYQRLLDAVK